jgi:hypothetical protein
MCGGIGAAVHIRSGYVKLLGSNFLWHCFLLARVPAEAPRVGGAGCSSLTPIGTTIIQLKKNKTIGGNVLHEA